MSKPIEVGDVAPNFTLQDHSGKDVKLSDLKGKTVIIYFYPKDFTSGCTTESCDFRDNYARLQSSGAEVIGISPDDSAKHAKFRDEYKLPFMLLVDADHKVMKAYGAWGMKKNYGKEYEGVIRSTFILDGKGNIAKSWRNIRVKGHVDKVLAEVQKLNQ